MAKTLAEQIAENATAPKKASDEAGSVEQHPLPDQIEVDRYTRSNEAVKRSGRGLRWTQIVPPGAD